MAVESMKKDKNAVREARWAEKLEGLSPEQREKRLAGMRERAAKLDAMSPEERTKFREERKARRPEAD
jgi:hypothetical protein